MKRKELDHIQIKGASEHNLRHVDVAIPKKKLVVLSGVSGSGKSSLAFDTLYAEGQRRYVESLSAYARQFLDRLDKPRYDTIRGLSPTISIEQKTASNNPRSTVGTITEIADYLRVLYARVGEQSCHRCGREVAGQTAEQIAHELLAAGRALGKKPRLLLLAPLLVNRKGEHRELLADARQAGYVRLRVDGEVVASEDLVALDKRRKHTVEAVVDRLVVTPQARTRLNESVEQALEVGGGEMIAKFVDGEERIFSESMACLHCRISFPKLTPQSFSFNSPQGMCADCNGLGAKVAIDPERVVQDRNLTLDEGAVVPWGEDVSKKTQWAHGFRGQLVKHLKIPTNKPWRSLSKRQRDALLYGTGDKKYRVKWRGKSGQGTLDVAWEGLVNRLMRRFSQTRSERAKRWYGRFMGNAICATCRGSRLRAESAAVRISGTSIVEVSAKTVADARQFFVDLELAGANAAIAEELLKEIRSRLEFLRAVGLDYLSLDRPGPTLSGGESQRIRLASQVGSELTGVIYILDEPSIGLHQRDNSRLLNTLLEMRDIGNTVVVVEHDEETIRAADHIIDFGPGAGLQGGHVVFSGTPAQLLRSKRSLTGAYLSGSRKIEVPEKRRVPKGWIEVFGAEENNLDGVDVAFPLEVLTAVTGVSGAGKSSLVNRVLYPALARELHRSEKRVGRHQAVKGVQHIDKVINIDQKPIGRTPRSNPATYIKVFDEIRKFFALLPTARTHGYKPGRFSFNVKGGRCESCQGDGLRRVEMHFLSDVYVRCEQCKGKRFNEATLEVRYRGKSISDVLSLTIDEAVALFSSQPRIRQPLELLQQVGLGYMPLGQSSPTLSGGEAQRIKLARELRKRATGRTLYILDEPTTGLHFDDIRKLLSVLQQLVDAGNSVIVIEHNLDVVKVADHVIDLGPEGGPHGGTVVAQGTPEEVATAGGSFTGTYLRPVLPALASKTKPKRRRKKAAGRR